MSLRATLPLIFLLPLAMGCQQGIPAREVTEAPKLAPPPPTELSAPVAEWAPGKGYTEWVARAPRAREGIYASQQNTELYEASYRFQRITGKRPNGLDELRAQGLLWHLPAPGGGASIDYVPLPESGIPVPGTLGLEWGATEVVVAMTVPGDPLPASADFEWASADRLAPHAILTRDQWFERSLGRFPLATTPVPISELPHFANGLVFGSDQLNDTRVALLQLAVDRRLQFFVKTFGRMPSSWDEVLTTLEYRAIGYETAPVARDPEPNECWLRVEVNPANMLVKYTTKVSVPAVDVVYEIYTPDAAAGRVLSELKHDLGFAEPSGFITILDTPVRTDPIPGEETITPVEGAVTAQ